MSEALIMDKIPMSVNNGLIVLLFTGTPSITNKGEFDPDIEPSPLILISCGAPGVPDDVVTLKPATRP